MREANAQIRQVALRWTSALVVVVVGSFVVGSSLALAAADVSAEASVNPAGNAPSDPSARASAVTTTDGSTNASHAPDVLAQTKLLIAGRDYAGALVLLDAQPRLRGDHAEAVSFDLNFLAGVAEQQLAAQSAAPQPLLQRAAGSYQAALRARPHSAASLNNLADVQARLGQLDAARASYLQAATEADPRHAFYLLNLAKFLQRNREPAEAVKYAAEAYKAAPNNAQVQKFCAELYGAEQPERLVPFAEKLLDGGHTDLAQTLALRGIGNSTWSATQRSAWLILLARTFVADTTFAYLEAAPVRDGLRQAAQDPAVGVAEGARSLAAILQAPPPGPELLAWWRDQSAVVAPLQQSGRGAMGALLRQLGDHAAGDDVRAADKYLRVAIEFGEHGPDPEAFLRAVELYAKHDDRASLQLLMDRYQWELFSEKSEAYAKGDWELIYRMHMALGMTYSYLKVWRSGPEFQNALFQLEHAQMAAERANEQALRSGEPALYSLPPRAVQKLAEGYAATGRSERFAQFRTSAAKTARIASRQLDAERIAAVVSRVATQPAAQSATQSATPSERPIAPKRPSDLKSQ